MDCNEEQPSSQRKNISSFASAAFHVLAIPYYLFGFVIVFPILVLSIVYILLMNLLNGIYLIPSFSHYIVTNDPEPFREQWRETRFPISSAPKPKPPATTRQEVVEFIIVRELLVSVPVKDPSAAILGNSHEEDEACRTSKDPVSVKAENQVLRFSAPLEPRNSIFCPTPVPRYHLARHQMSTSAEDMVCTVREPNPPIPVLKDKSSWAGSKTSIPHDDAGQRITPVSFSTEDAEDKLEQAGGEAGVLLLDVEMPVKSETTSEKTCHHIPSLEMFPAPNAQNHSYERCDLCASDYTVRDQVVWLRSPGCVHTYHMGCIDNWLKYELTCPVCKHRSQPREECKQSDYSGHPGGV